VEPGERFSLSIAIPSDFFELKKLSVIKDKATKIEMTVAYKKKLNFFVLIIDDITKNNPETTINIPKTRTMSLSILFIF